MTSHKPLELPSLKKEFHEKLHLANSPGELEELRVCYFGKKGLIQDLMSALKSAPKEEIPHLGKQINLFKEELLKELEAKKGKVEEADLLAGLEQERFDVTLPATLRTQSHSHPVLETIEKMTEILRSLGLREVHSDEIAEETVNFDLLNFPPDHPAKDMQDTFYLNDSMLLRTHTTTFQVPMMRRYQPPMALFCAGRVFRNEEVTSRSHQQFSQIDAFHLGKGVSLSDLLALLRLFYKRLFGDGVVLRFRKSYFPFTEPSVEIDISCIRCGQKGCPICKHTGFLEVAGAGMIHPNVIKAGGHDPEVYTGWAFGMGVDRTLMLLHNIPDIRLLWESDNR
ncbi:MAG: phenylalanine--tRNA ligase subunit alpha, partial [Chlamydiia bacterium]